MYTKSKCLLKINKIDDYYTDVKNIKIPCAELSIPKLPPIIYPPFRPIIDPIWPIRPIPIIDPIIPIRPPVKPLP